MRNKISYLTVSKLITKHFSFIIIILSSAVFFILNIWIKFKVSEEVYSEYGLFLSYLNLSLTFALLGMDQVLLRKANFDGNVFHFNKDILYISVIFLGIFSAFASTFFKLNFEINVSWLNIFITALLSGINIFIFNTFRLHKLFTAAQIQKNIWRLLVFTLSILIYSKYKILTLELLVTLVNISLTISIILHHRKLRKLKINLNKIKGFDLHLWINFCLSMLIINILSNADRFVIGTFLNPNEVGEYFFLQNIFLFPLTQLQNYSGFRELTAFKSNYNINLVHQGLKRNFILAIATSTLLLIGLFVFKTTYNEPQLKYNLSNNLLIVCILLIGVVRILYSVLAAAMGARGNTKQIAMSNWSSLALFAVIVAIFWISGFLNDLLSISIMFLTLWLVRITVFYINVRTI